MTGLRPSCGDFLTNAICNEKKTYMNEIKAEKGS
jgi:hypothetical protein